MKSVLIIFSCFFISKTSTYTLSQVKGVQGFVTNLQFDSFGNIYLTTDAFTGQPIMFYKLSSSNEVLWKQKLSNVSDIWEMFINSRNELYFNLWMYETKYTISYVDVRANMCIFAVLRSNSQTIEVVDTFTHSYLYMDKNDNLFYSNEKGVYVYRPSSNVPVQVENLQNFSFVYHLEVFVVDDYGNVYTVVRTDGGNDTLAVITRESLEEDIPHATFLNITDSLTQNIMDLYVDKNNDVWISLTDISSNDGIFKKLSNGHLETVAMFKSFPYSKALVANERIFLIMTDSNDSITNIYLESLDDHLVEIPELTNLTIGRYETHALADGKGFAYLHTSLVPFSLSLGSLILFKPDEMRPVPISIRSSEIIEKLYVDFNEDLWVRTLSGIYFLKKGQIVLDRVTIPEGACKSKNDLKASPVTNEVYVQCDGLYTVR